MIRTARFFVTALLVTAPLHVGCGAVLGYEDSYAVGVSAAGSSSSSVCDARSPKFRCVGTEIVQICNVQSSLYETGALCQSGERCDALSGGCVTSAAGAGGKGGNAGSGQGGNAGSGNAGSGPGGNAGSGQGGNAGTSNGGNAGTTSGGNAGTSTAGNAGSSNAGNAGTSNGGNGGTMAGGGGGSGPVNPTDCSVLYVDPGATTDGDGCAPAKPVRTIATALSVRKQATTEIRICAGTLEASTIQLDVPISLAGSYACGDWSRPSALDVQALTTIVKSSVEGAAVVVSTAGVGRTTFIEGIHFVGASIGKKSRALAVTLGAKPTIRFNRIQGGKGVGPDFPALGMQVTAAAAPRLENNLIEAGEGDVTGPSVASVALLLTEDAGPAEIVGNTIKGGKATTHGQGYGSVGLFVLPLKDAALTGDAAIRDNIISGGDGNDTANVVEFLSTGVFLDETSAGARGAFQIVGGSIRGSNAAHDGAPSNSRIPSAIGLHSGKHQSLEISRVRIYGGDSSEKTGSGIAVSLGGPGTTLIRSSVLHGGGANDTTPSPRAIETRQTGGLSVLGSTLFVGFPRAVSAGATSAKGIYASGAGPLVLRGNLFVFQGGQATAVQLEDTCSLPAGGGSILANNGFVFSRKTDQGFFSGSGCAAGTGSTLASFAGIFGAESSGNLRVTPDTSAPTDIPITCANDGACVQAALTSYDSASYGRAQVLDLASNAFTPKSCALGKGNVGLTENPTDLFGKPRPATNGTMGAIELAPGICP